MTLPLAGRFARSSAHGAIRAYQLTLSGMSGRQCRFLPTCSEFADEAIQTHGLWAGGWMAAGRLCRCHPWGGSGFEPVPRSLPAGADWRRPWRYATRYERASSSAASP